MLNARASKLHIYICATSVCLIFTSTIILMYGKAHWHWWLRVTFANDIYIIYKNNGSICRLILSCPPAIAIPHFLLSVEHENCRVEESLDHFKDVPNGSIAGESQEETQWSTRRWNYCICSHEWILLFELHFGACIFGIKYCFVLFPCAPLQSILS